MSGPWEHWEGQVVNGEFHLHKYLGGSERSAVFLTDHAGLALKKAAIKLIPADPKTADLQLSAWAMAANLAHPHLIRLFEAGRCELAGANLLYVVMEFADEDLSQILPSRPLTPAEAREMLLPALDALAYLHKQGLVHQHIKPANILAVADQVKISSDGIRRTFEPNGRLSPPGPYDPPEAASGAVSPSGDVWSLGITLVEALTQRLLVMEAGQFGDPILPETLPAPLFDVASHCLRRDPQRRCTVADITAHLQANPSVRSEPSPQPSQQSPLSTQKVPLRAQPTTTRPQPRSAIPRYALPLVVGALALVAIFGVAKLLSHRQPAPPLVSELPNSPPKPDKRPVAPKSGKSTLKSNIQKQGSNPTGALSGSTDLQGVDKPHASGLVPGEALDQALPDVPQRARDTIQGTLRVNVRVRVDPSGNVLESTLDSPGPSRYFANLALEAARRWSFSPAKVDGRNVSSEWLLRFEFERTRTKVFPAELAP